MKNFSKKSLKIIDYRFKQLSKNYNCSMCSWWGNSFEAEGCSCPSLEYWYQCFYYSETAEGIQDMLRFASSYKKN